MCDIVEVYSNVSAGYWMPAATLVPGRRQACEHLIGHLKRSKDMD